MGVNGETLNVQYLENGYSQSKTDENLGLGVL